MLPRLPKTARGSEVAVLLLLTLEPDFSQKQIAHYIGRDISRVSQILKRHRTWIENYFLELAKENQGVDGASVG